MPADHLPKHHSAVVEVTPLPEKYHYPENSHTLSNFPRITHLCPSAFLSLWVRHLQQPKTLIFIFNSLVIHGVGYAAGSFHILDIATPLLQYGRLLLTAEITFNNQEHNPSSYEEISMYKFYCYRDS